VNPPNLPDPAVRDVIIIGAGPSGLAAAIAASQRGLRYEVLEQGVLVNSIYRFPPQMVFFTTPELLEIGRLPFLSPFPKPTRAEALKYYRKVVDTYDLQIAFQERVVDVRAGGAGAAGGSDGADRAFEVETRNARGAKTVRLARHVIFAIGYYDRPVMLHVPGEDLPHVHHFYGDPHIHYRQRVVVVGGGNSAAEAALELFRAGAQVTIVHRRPSLKRTIKYWVRPDVENRIKEGSIAARFSSRVTEIRQTSVVVQGIPDDASVEDEAARQRELFADADASDAPAAVVGSPRAAPPVEEIPADAVYLLTGYRADAELMCRAGVRLNDRQAPVHDAATFETNVPGLFIAGGAIAGVDTGTIFIENGRFHGEKIIDVITKKR